MEEIFVESNNHIKSNAFLRTMKGFRYFFSWTIFSTDVCLKVAYFIFFFRKKVLYLNTHIIFHQNFNGKRVECDCRFYSTCILNFQSHREKKIIPEILFLHFFKMNNPLYKLWPKQIKTKDIRVSWVSSIKW